MTVYTIDIGSNSNIEFISENHIKDNGNDPNEFTITLRAEHGYTFAKGNTVTIYRDGTSCFIGIVEHIQTTMTNDGSVEIVSGRHKKVLLWRKWCERYADDQGFWTNYYPNKIIEFLLRPSISELIEDSDYGRIGYGLDSGDWVITCSPDTNYYNLEKTFSPDSARDRLSAVGYRSALNQASGQYVQVDIGEVKSIVAIRIEDKGSSGVSGNLAGDYESYIRNYEIYTSTDGVNWGTAKASKTNNRAISIVESWTPANARYIKILCTAAFPRLWFISDIYIYEADTQISGITVGTIDEHLPLNTCLLSANVSAGATTVTVEKPWLFNIDDTVLLGENGTDEALKVSAVNGSIITFYTAITGTYHTADAAFLQNTDTFPMIDIDYSRRLDAIQQICKLCLTDEEEWQFEVTDAGVVNFSLRTGTDKTDTISFIMGQNIGEDTSNTDYRQVVDRVMVVGKGDGDKQDQTSSGWIGSGDYELIEVDSNVSSKEGAINVAKGILQKSSAENNVHVVNTRDNYATNTWGIDDLITVTDAISGFLDEYRVKKVTRTYNSKGEAVKIECTGKILRGTKVIDNIYDQWKRDRLSREEYDKWKHAYDEKSYIIKLEAELGIWDKTKVTKFDDTTASNAKCLGTNYTLSGWACQSGTFGLEAGTYKAIFYSKVTDNSVVGTIAVFDVYTPDDGGVVLGTKTVTGTSYAASETFQKIEVPFNTDTNRSRLSLRITTVVSTTNIYIDYYAIQSGFDYLLDDPPGAPATPTGLNATGGVGGIAITWNANTEKDLEHYKLYKWTTNTPASATVIARVTGTGYYWQCPAASYDVTQYFWLTAVDRCQQESAKSTVDSAHADSADVSIPPGSIDSDLLAIEQRKWISDTMFEYNDVSGDLDTIYWHAISGPPVTDRTGDSNITFDGVSTYTLPHGNTGNLLDGVHYIYWHETSVDSGVFEVLHTTDYSDAVGVGKGVMAITQIRKLTYGEGPSIVTFNSYLPTIAAGVISAYSIFSKHIINDEWIESKMIRTRAAGYDRVEMSTSGFKAYGGSILQFLDTDTETVDAYMGATDSGLLIQSVAPVITINVGGASALTLNQSGKVTFSNTFTDISPASGGGVDLGTNTEFFNNIYARYFNIQTVVSGSKGTAGSYPGQFLLIRSAISGVKSYLYVSMKNSANVYEWVQVAISS